MADEKISDLTDGSPLLKDDLFVIARSGENKKIDAAHLSLGYRKTTAKQVVNTVAETDLLNGEITVAAGALGSDRILKLIAFGDWLQQSGSSQDIPRLRLKFGGTTLFDQGTFGTSIGSSATRLPWTVKATIMNLGATNSQWARFRQELVHTGTSIVGQNPFSTGEGETLSLLHNAAPNSRLMVAIAGVAGTIDTTAACVLALTTVLPTANSNVDMTLKGAFVKIE